MCNFCDLKNDPHHHKDYHVAPLTMHKKTPIDHLKRLFSILISFSHCYLLSKVLYPHKLHPCHLGMIDISHLMGSMSWTNEHRDKWVVMTQIIGFGDLLVGVMNSGTYLKYLVTELLQFALTSMYECPPAEHAVICLMFYRFCLKLNIWNMVAVLSYAICKSLFQIRVFFLWDVKNGQGENWVKVTWISILTNDGL